MSELSDEVLEHAINYPGDLSPGNMIALLKELKERRASALLGEAATEKTASEFDFSELEIWGCTSGETGLVFNYPNPGDQSVCLRHKPSGKMGYVKLNV